MQTVGYTVGLVLDSVFCLLVCSTRLGKQGFTPSKSLFPSICSLPSTLAAVPPTHKECRMSPGISHLNPNAVRYQTTRAYPQQQIQKQPRAKGSVISIAMGSSPMAKQNLFLSGSFINITSRGLKGAELLTREWLSAIKMERAACLIFLRKRDALEGGQGKDKGY